jgi:hypothetical protein
VHSSGPMAEIHGQQAKARLFRVPLTIDLRLEELSYVSNNRVLAKIHKPLEVMRYEQQNQESSAHGISDVPGG